ncbi:MAG: TMEM165/GDT1 family protein [Candidatus Kariarchaeaceae archaeon]
MNHHINEAMLNDFWTVVISTTFVMALAEFGDKTNLIVLSLMSKTKQPFTVAIGGTIGIIFTSLLGILFGSFLGLILPLSLIPIFSGLVFIILGIWAFWGDNPENHDDFNHQNIDADISSRFNALKNSISLVALAEFGDKSQVFLITGSIIENPWAVFLGAVLGMGLIMGLAAFLGYKIIQNISEESLHKIAGIAFFIAGIWIIGANI